MTFFQDCTTLNEVKSLYRTLAKIHHPDKGGDLVTMQRINNEYSFAIASIAKGEKLSQQDIDNEIVNAEQYKEAINAIINLLDIHIEICGGWIWVTGNTYQHKSIFKSNGFYFASKKVAWYFRSAEYKVHNNRLKLSLDDIRTKYGTQSIKGNYTSLHLN